MPVVDDDAVDPGPPAVADCRFVRDRPGDHVEVPIVGPGDWLGVDGFVVNVDAVGVDRFRGCEEGVPPTELSGIDQERGFEARLGERRERLGHEGREPDLVSGVRENRREGLELPGVFEFDRQPDLGRNGCDDGFEGGDGGSGVPELGLGKRVEGNPGDGPAAGGRPVEGPVVDDDRLAARTLLHVDLDRVDPGGDRPDCRERVFGLGTRTSPVTDDLHGPASLPKEKDPRSAACEVMPEAPVDTRMSGHRRFVDRTEAGDRLGAALRERGVDVDLVLAIPRGGLPLGRAVADALSVPLDIVVAQKIGAPNNPEYAIGAVGSDGTVWRNEEAIRLTGASETYFEDERERKAAAAREKAARYRDEETAPDVSGKAVAVVDDGVATGSTMRACLQMLSATDVERLIVAVPVGPPETISELETMADEVVCLERPRAFQGVGQFYDRFDQVTDEEAIAFLEDG